MKFIKKENTFTDILAVRKYYCILEAAYETCPCILGARYNGKGVSCIKFCEKYPEIAAKAMGFKVVDDSDL